MNSSSTKISAVSPYTLFSFHEDRSATGTIRIALLDPYSIIAARQQQDDQEDTCSNGGKFTTTHMILRKRGDPDRRRCCCQATPIEPVGAMQKKIRPWVVLPDICIVPDTRQARKGFR